MQIPFECWQPSQKDGVPQALAITSILATNQALPFVPWKKKTTFEPLLIGVEHCRTAALRVALKVDPDRKSLEEILQKMVSVNSFDLRH